jgi:DNA-directed RNA polymerase specialized sigma24 family protein
VRPCDPPGDDRAFAVSRAYSTQMTTPDPSPDDAFQRAAEELWMPVYRFALALTNDLGEADDVAQEAFLRLWQHRASIDWSAPPIGWLLVTARRVAFDRFRRLARTCGEGRRHGRLSAWTRRRSTGSSTSAARWRG